ncbi:MFS transporter [Lentibacillus sp. L22]|uniref:MFS transporter n=1 Tax=Lentibacillus TaxID=175304 RepID=UPI0022B1A211|nr:MFS transporter [Lentibacillus daqui]
MNKNYQEPIWTKSFIGISVTQFMVYLTFYALLTTLPIFVIKQLGGTNAQGGLAVTLMLITAIIVRPFSAKFLDWVGKKKGLIICVAIYTATTFVYIWTDQFMPLMLLRLFHGISFGVISTATGAIAADVIPEKRRGEGLGYFAMAMNLAVVAGPFISLTLLQFVSFQVLFTTLSILMIGGIVCSLVVHVAQNTNTQQEQVNKKFSLHDMIELKALPISLICSLASLAYASVLSFVSVYSESIGLASVSSYFFLVFAIVMIISRPYFGPLFDTKGPKYVILPCLLLFAVGLAALSITHNGWMLLLSAALTGLGYGTILPSFQTMAIQAAPSHRSSHATATFFMVYDTGIAVGSFIWGFVVSGFGFPSLYLLCALLVVVTTILFMVHQSWQHKHHTPQSNELSANTSS